MKDYVIYETQEESLSHKGLRFIIINNSITGHCCFEASVIDTSKEIKNNGYGSPNFDYSWWIDDAYMGEMFNVETAIKVCSALNLNNSLI